ncbi:sulfatase-like hydrolase/transferase [Thermoleophilia bacterium SCSIO 60948]|nr:sulfatase-like hydrolase/transferase [Thermoleophilia bacterium SCSIO 60948]
MRRLLSFFLAAVVATGALVLAIRATRAEPVAAASAQGREERPNIVVIMTDDQEWASMPVLESVESQIAARGVTFENFFASFPVCSPSRATLLTGRYAHNHHVIGNKPPYGGAAGLLGGKSTAAALHADGYQTAWIGKYLNGYGKRVRKIERPAGWDRFVAPVSGAHRYFDYSLSDNGEITSYGRGPRDYVVDVVGRKTRRTLRRQAGRPEPFFTVMSLLSPHGEPPREVEGRLMNPRPAHRYRDVFRELELPRPPSFDEADVSDKPAYVRRPRLGRRQELELRKRYRGRMTSLLAADDAIAATMQTLRRAGVSEETYVIFVSDNGYMLGEHRMKSKTDLYEESVRVPLVISGPELPSGVVRSQMTANVDLAATILDVAGAEPLLTSQDGESLIPFAADPAHRSDRAVLLENRNASGVRVPGYVYVEHSPRSGGTDYELYDLEADPYELENLLDPDSGDPRTDDPAEADRIRALRTQLESRLEALRDCEGEECAA